MESKASLKGRKSTTQLNQSLSSLLPYLILIMGLCLTFSAWILIDYLENHEHLKVLLQLSLSLIVLVVGVCFSLSMTILVRLISLYRSRKHSLKSIRMEIQREMAERRKAEEAQKQLEMALLQSQKLQAIGTLAGGIAHDFNNILYAIIGYVEMARQDLSPESPIFANLGKVLEAALRGKDLISQILTFGRKHPHYLMKFLNIREMLDSVFSLLKPTIPAGIVINLIDIPPNAYLLGNQIQLHQVIINMVNNAVDAMEGEGTLTLRFHLEESQNDCLSHFPLLSIKNYCQIDISDTGHGMDQVTMERIYEPFFTTKAVDKGTGLGLSSAHTIVSEHQGKVIVKSNLGKGTTFSLFFPNVEMR